MQRLKKPLTHNSSIPGRSPRSTVHRLRSSSKKSRPPEPRSQSELAETGSGASNPVSRSLRDAERVYRFNNFELQTSELSCRHQDSAFFCFHFCFRLEVWPGSSLKPRPSRLKSLVNIAALANLTLETFRFSILLDAMTGST